MINVHYHNVWGEADWAESWMKNEIMNSLLHKLQIAEKVKKGGGGGVEFPTKRRDKALNMAIIETFTRRGRRLMAPCIGGI